MWDVSVLDRQMIAIVWPRMPSHYGKKIVWHIVDQLAGYDVATISGLADGIDMLCHHRSLDLQIPTVAVLGGGIHYFLTREKRSLIDRIVGQWWLIVSEYKLDAKPTNYSFPQRNRLIAWLSHLMILPEAWIKSGSLITADYGISFHKPVYGVMNSIFQPSSAGLLSYIQQWLIKPLYDVSTVLDQYCHPKHHDHPNSPQDIHLDDTQQQIYQYISQHPKCQIHDILAQTGINIGDLQTALAYLEMYDLVSQPKVGIYTVLWSPVYPPNITTP
jgi:DNA processing protein